MRAIALAASSFAGLTSPDFTRGAAGLNHAVTGVDPKKPRRRSSVHGSVSRFLVIDGMARRLEYPLLPGIRHTAGLLVELNDRHWRNPLAENAELDQRRRTAATEDGIDLLADGLQCQRLDQRAMRAGLDALHGGRFIGLVADDEDADAGKFRGQFADQSIAPSA